MLIEIEADRPNLPGLERALRANLASYVLGLALARDRIEL
jgi:hypothetical protein